MSVPDMNCAYSSAQLLAMPFGDIAITEGAEPFAAVSRVSAVPSELTFSLAGPLLM